MTHFHAYSHMILSVRMEWYNVLELHMKGVSKVLTWNGENYYTTAEIAEMLHVTPGTVRRKIASGELKAITLGKMLYVLESELGKALEWKDANSNIDMFQRILEHAASVKQLPSGECIFYNDDGEPLMQARLATTSGAVQSLGDGE